MKPPDRTPIYGRTGRQVCWCGRGYISKVDWKCGHCRTTKTIKPFGYMLDSHQHNRHKRIIDNESQE